LRKYNEDKLNGKKYKLFIDPAYHGDLESKVVSMLANEYLEVYEVAPGRERLDDRAEFFCYGLYVPDLPTLLVCATDNEWRNVLECHKNISL